MTNTSFSCIDLMFNSNASLITEIDIEIKPTKNIERSIEACDQARLFINLTINERVELLSNKLINIFRSYFPNKKIKFKNIKSALRKRSRLTKIYYVNGQVLIDYNLLLSHSKKCREMILSAKNEYMPRMSKTLSDTSIATKSYWSILGWYNWFLSNEKIPSIPPLFHNGKVISDFKEIINLFNSYFSSQCIPVSNSSVLPDISFHENARLKSFSITEKDILAIIKSLDPNKSHGWDNILIKMIKLCGKLLALPLEMIFEAALNNGAFLNDWEKGNIVPVHKKDLKTVLINYLPISLLPIFAKI